MTPAPKPTRRTTNRRLKKMGPVHRPLIRATLAARRRSAAAPRPGAGIYDSASREVARIASARGSVAAAASSFHGNRSNGNNQGGGRAAAVDGVRGSQDGGSQRPTASPVKGMKDRSN